MSRAGRREIAVVAAIAVGATFVAWQPLREGGLFFDDWWFRGLALYNRGPLQNDFLGYWDGLHRVVGYRPLSVVYYMAQVALNDFEPFRYQLWNCLASALAGVSLYVALRVARLPWLFAAAVAVVFVVIPFAASAKFWAAGSVINASIAVFCAGLALGGLALRQWPTRRRWGLLAGSVVILAATAALYELPLPLLLVAPVYYAAAGGRWHKAVFTKAAADLLLAAAVLVIFRTSRTETAPADEWPSHALQIFDEAVSLFGRGLVPDGRWRLIVIAVCVVAAAALVTRLVSGRGQAVWGALTNARRRLARLAVIAVLGFLVALLGYAFLVPDPWYRPLMPGQGDRTNGVAVIGYAVAYIAIAGMLAVVATAAVPRRWTPAWSVAVFGALVLSLTGSFAAESRVKGELYVAAWQRAQALYQAIDETLGPGPRPGVLVLGFGFTANVAPLMPALGEWSDFDAAVKLASETGTVRAAAIFETQPVLCEADEIALPAQYQGGPVFGAGWSAPYREVMFIQPYDGRADYIDSRRECRSALRRYTPGPLL